ncbi:IclR family transcriptional regulator C-terminal domain-containing protein [Arthrobacter alpinus]|nr:IclR family transcriptional regulator C-terminal domain-containing protein [Arthrobacter alpinus]
MAEIRQLGYSAMAGIIVPESSGVAVPVFGPDGRAVAALSVIVPIHSENVLATVPVLKAAARGISRALGWTAQEPAPLRRSLPGP